MKITVFGFEGTGKSSTSNLLSRKLGYIFKSSGNMMREIALERGFDSLEGLNTYRLNKLKEQNDYSIDKELDLYIEKFGKENDNFVFESRLAWNLIPDSFKIKLICSEDVRAERVASRDKISLDEARENNARRQLENTEIYKTAYGLKDYPPKDNLFDVIVDTGKMPLNQVVEYLYRTLQDKNLI